MFNASIKEKIGLWLPQTLSALVGCLPAIAAALFDSLGLAKLLESQSPAPFAKAALWLLSVAIWLVAYILYKRPRYKFYPELSLKGDSKKGLWFCPKCQSPMRIEKDHFFCIPCKEKVSLPNKQTAEMVWRTTKQNVHL